MQTAFSQILQKQLWLWNIFIVHQLTLDLDEFIKLTKYHFFGKPRIKTFNTFIRNKIQKTKNILHTPKQVPFLSKHTFCINLSTISSFFSSIKSFSTSVILLKLQFQERRVWYTSKMVCHWQPFYDQSCCSTFAQFSK